MILSTWTPSSSYFFFVYKMFEKHLWNTFLQYVVVEIWQLVNEVNSSPEVLYKRGDLKNFSKVRDKHNNHPEVNQKISLKILQNSKVNIFAVASFLIKLQAGKLKLSEAAT